MPPPSEGDPGKVSRRHARTILASSDTSSGSTPSMRHVGTHIAQREPPEAEKSNRPRSRARASRHASPHADRRRRRPGGRRALASPTNEKARAPTPRRPRSHQRFPSPAWLERPPRLNGWRGLRGPRPWRRTSPCAARTVSTTLDRCSALRSGGRVHVFRASIHASSCCEPRPAVPADDAGGPAVPAATPLMQLERDRRRRSALKH